MPIKMLMDAVGATDDTGSSTRMYKADEELPNTDFGNKIGKIFVEAGLAVETKVVEPTETKTTVTGKRARNKKGQLMADNPETPDYNEAWEGGKAPK